MDRGLKVRNEGSVARCEICHQNDCLDAETGECLRCRNVVIPIDLLRSHKNKEESFGLAIPFGRIRAARVVSIVLAAAFASNLIGPIAGFLLISLCFTWFGLQRVLNDRTITGYQPIDLTLNLAVMGSGLAGCCYSSIYLLRWFGILR